MTSPDLPEMYYIPVGKWPHDQVAIRRDVTVAGRRGQEHHTVWRVTNGATLTIDDLNTIDDVVRVVPATWDGLMSILTEHYPPDLAERAARDPGAQIVALTFALDDARQQAGQVSDD